ncbi:HlyC/CorC family transporter [Natronosporangium hydrolyticum]|uniref:HlyC/CorC family transporter n=1 Tax=Natronosporangium hydrolyticum TaxID=2811111 RepID=A0A895YC43_9ACTN|nr:hemolysin family protein [Natronosporangium hydrolyticum]QSB15394.1 HlyC/CorC family transporter [Natronosporangium hydrolyticum]
MSDTTAILIAIALLAGNAFFVGAEFALISARRSQIEPLAATSRRARITLRAMERVSLMMACAQLGITACSLGLGAIGEPAVAHVIEPWLAALGVPPQLLHPIAFAIALTVVVCLHMVLGEMVPKNIAIAGPERAALWLGPPLAGITAMLRPLIVTLNALANAVLRLCRVAPREELASAYTVDQVAELITQSRREGLLDDEEHTLLTNALTLNEQTVGTVLLPAHSLVTLPVDTTPAQVQDACVRTGYSRFPVTDPAGEMVGYLHVKDVLTQDPHAVGRPIDPSLIRPFAIVRAGDTLRSALATMQTAGAHLALILDGTGQPIGIAALEDVLEELVGEVRDATQQTA